MASSPSDGSSSFLPLGPTRGGSAGILLYHSMPALLHLLSSTTSGGLGVECLHPSLDVSGSLCVSCSCIRSSSSVHVSGRTCQWSTQTFDSGGTILNRGSLASHSSQHVAGIAWHCCIIKDLVIDVLVGHMVKGLPYLIFNPLAAQMSVVLKGALFLSLSGSGGDNSSVYVEGLPAVLERMERLVYLSWFTK